MAGDTVRRISPTTFRIARRGTSREVNRQIALNLIRSKQPVSRADLARLMGMRRGAVSRLVDELLEAGLVFEGAKGASPRGRKPTHLHVETRRRCVAAVDVSASHTAFVMTDVLGRHLLEVAEFPDAPPPAAARQGRGGRRRPRPRNPPGARRVHRRRGLGVGAGGRRRSDPLLPHPRLAKGRAARAAEGGDEAAGGGRELDEGLHARAGVVGAGRHAGGRPGRVRQRLRRRRRGRRRRRASCCGGRTTRPASWGTSRSTSTGPAARAGSRDAGEAYVSKRAVIARYRGTVPLLAGLGRAAARTTLGAASSARARRGRARGAPSRRSRRDGVLPSAAASRPSSRRWTPGGSTSGARSRRAWDLVRPHRPEGACATTSSSARPARRGSSPSRSASTRGRAAPRPASARPPSPRRTCPDAGARPPLARLSCLRPHRRPRRARGRRRASPDRPAGPGEPPPAGPARLRHRIALQRGQRPVCVHGRRDGPADVPGSV